MRPAILIARRLPIRTPALVAFHVLISIGMVHPKYHALVIRLRWAACHGVPSMWSTRRDAGGEALWYAVSKNFWSNPKTTPLNSETSGQLFLDARGDVVAVVFAPGSSVNSQARPSNSIADYLENDNGDDPPDSNFVSAAAGEFNDEVITITRAELMAAVERRVLGEFAQAYERYRSNPDQNPFTPATNYPWLTPFSNPKDPDKMFGATATQRQGQCFCDKDGRRFTAGSITLSFLIPPADGSVTPDPPPINALCLRNDTCTDKGCTFTAPALSGTCDWTNRNRVKCQLAGSTTCGALVRSYTIAMDYTVSPPPDTGTVNVNGETPSQVRTRDVTRTQSGAKASQRDDNTYG